MKWIHIICGVVFLCSTGWGSEDVDSHRLVMFLF